MCLVEPSTIGLVTNCSKTATHCSLVINSHKNKRHWCFCSILQPKYSLLGNPGPKLLVFGTIYLPTLSVHKAIQMKVCPICKPYVESIVINPGEVNSLSLVSIATLQVDFLRLYWITANCPDICKHIFNFLLMHHPHYLTIEICWKSISLHRGLWPLETRIENWDSALHFGICPQLQYTAPVIVTNFFNFRRFFCLSK